MPTGETLSPKASTTARPKRSPQPALSEILTPGFRTAAAVAGWDEESILLASLVVEDTPVRESRCKKRSNPHLTSPRSSSSSTRKRRSARRPAPEAIPPIALCLDEDDDKERGSAVGGVEEKGKGSKESSTACGNGLSDVGVGEKGKGSKDSAEKDSGKGLECMDRLREELSCAICLEICFEPSTTPCGHSFCLKCLKCAAAKCGKRCPKCRQIISIGRACTVNTVLWNTIQLLFPAEVEEKKKAVSATSRSRVAQTQSPNSFENNRRGTSSSLRIASQAPRGVEQYRNSSRIALQVPRSVEQYRNSRRPVSNQSDDAALALRLQREEFMVAFQDPRRQQRNTGGNLRDISNQINSRSRYI